ncbi:MAG TPA: hypothetical protein VE262_10750, partial [Blastocatellia bacterium]|nr:hypothetical protein [Blastocatellia bacterium]
MKVKILSISLSVCLALGASLAPARAQSWPDSPEAEAAPQSGLQMAQPAAKDKFGAGHVLGFTQAHLQPSVGQLAQQAGVKWAREDFSWPNMEPSPGAYSFSNQDTFVNNLVARNISIIGQLNYTPQFYSSNPSAPNYFIYATTTTAGLNAWAAFVTATVSRYKDRIKHWQIWPNVDDHEFWHPVPGVTEYKNLLQRAYTAIKAEDPTATVIMAATDPTFLNALIDAGGAPFFDAIAAHNYANVAVPNPAAPEVSALTTIRLASLRDVSQRRAGGKPIWVTEYGWPTAPTTSIGVNEETQAAYLIRSMLLQGAYRDVPGVIWTDFLDFGAGDPNVASDNYGMLLKINGAQKMSFAAYQAMTTALGGAKYLRNQPPPPASSQMMDNFEGAQQYEVFMGGGATGSFAKASEAAHTGSFSGRINYNLNGSMVGAVIVAPSPSLFLNVSGTPTRFKLWARGTGGPAPGLMVAFRDSTGENFEAFVGLIVGTQWREYTYYMDGPQGASSLISSGGGDNDKVIDYPIRFGGLTLRPWSAGSPVGSGSVYFDDLTFESGPSVVNQIYRGSAATVHAVWSLTGSPQVEIPTTAASATTRDWRNVTATVPASNGRITVTAGTHPIFVTLPPTRNATTTGVFRPSNGSLFLKNSNSTGFADLLLTYGIPNDYPVAGDWDGDGVDSIGVYRNGTFLLRDTNTNGFADSAITFGAPGDQPVVGDWNGDGIDTIGVYRNGTFFLRNSNTAGAPDLVFELGIPGDVGIAGDWDGDGVVTTGVFRPSNGALFLKNSNTTGFADILLTYGLPGDRPIIGDWNGDGTDTIGVYRDGTFHLRNSNTNGFAEIVFSLGVDGDMPI